MSPAQPNPLAPTLVVLQSPKKFQSGARSTNPWPRTLYIIGGS
jgi:hypothetical protein